MTGPSGMIRCADGSLGDLPLLGAEERRGRQAARPACAGRARRGWRAPVHRARSPTSATVGIVGSGIAPIRSTKAWKSRAPASTPSGNPMTSGTAVSVVACECISRRDPPPVRAEALHDRDVDPTAPGRHVEGVEHRHQREQRRGAPPTRWGSGGRARRWRSTAGSTRRRLAGPRCRCGRRGDGRRPVEAPVRITSAAALVSRRAVDAREAGRRDDAALADTVDAADPGHDADPDDVERRRAVRAARGGSSSPMCRRRLSALRRPSMISSDASGSRPESSRGARLPLTVSTRTRPRFVGRADDACRILPRGPSSR